MCYFHRKISLIASYVSSFFFSIFASPRFFFPKNMDGIQNTWLGAEICCSNKSLSTMSTRSLTPCKVNVSRQPYQQKQIVIIHQPCILIHRPAFSARNYGKNFQCFQCSLATFSNPIYFSLQISSEAVISHYSLLFLKI